MPAGRQAGCLLLFPTLEGMTVSVPNSIVKHGVSADGRGLLSKLAFLNPLRLLPKVSARFHISTGLSSFVGSVVLLAIFLGLIPDQRVVL